MYVRLPNRLITNITGRQRLTHSLLVPRFAPGTSFMQEVMRFSGEGADVPAAPRGPSVPFLSPLCSPAQCLYQNIIS